MKRCVEYKGYQVGIEIFDVTGTGVLAMIKPLTDAAVQADERARVTDDSNMIVLKVDGASFPQERDESAFIDLRSTRRDD